MSQYDKFDVVTAKQDGRLLTVSFNRPDRLNAVGGGLGTQFEEILSIAREDDSVGCILVRGEGRAFCAGGDVREFDEEAKGGGTPPAKKVFSLLHGAKIIDIMLSVPQPMIAAVQGYAMGLGATYALFCDVVVAAEDAVFADAHVAIGLVAGDGGAVMWPLLMSLGAARWYLSKTYSNQRHTHTHAKPIAGEGRAKGRRFEKRPPRARRAIANLIVNVLVIEHERLSRNRARGPVIGGSGCRSPGYVEGGRGESRFRDEFGP